MQVKHGRQIFRARQGRHLSFKVSPVRKMAGKLFCTKCTTALPVKRGSAELRTRKKKINLKINKKVGIEKIQSSV